MNEKNPHDLPDPGPQRFWSGVHLPKNAKFPLDLELRERVNESGKAKISFSRLIAHQPTIADAKAVREAAEEILIRASQVDRFVGIIGEGAPA